MQIFFSDIQRVETSVSRWYDPIKTGTYLVIMIIMMCLYVFYPQGSWIWGGEWSPAVRLVSFAPRYVYHNLTLFDISRRERVVLLFGV